jgi:hypothetical protein
MGKGTIITLLCYLTIQGLALANEASAAKFHLDASDDFIGEKISVFAISQRATDPFGKPQDPHKKVVVAKKEEPKKAPVGITKKEQQILIEQEISKLGKKLNILGRRVIIGSKTYSRGDKISVSVKGKTFPLKFNSITSSKITFLDLSDKSIISLDMINISVIPRHSDKATTLGSDEPTIIDVDE